VLSKAHRRPFTKQLLRATRPLEYIHGNLSSQISPASIGGGEYYFQIIDGYMHYRWVYILVQKSEMYSNYKIFKASVENQSSQSIVHHTNDGGGEYVLKEFLSEARADRIINEVMAMATPIQNPVSEWANQTINEKARALLKHAYMPSEFWAEAVSTAVFLQNITPTSDDKITPYEKWHGQTFDNKRLRVFGCQAWVHLPKEKRDRKFSDTATPGVMLGYQLGMNNWHI